MVTSRQVAVARKRSLEYCTSTIRFTRPAGAPTFDPSTGTTTPATPTVLYDGPCGISDSTYQRTSTTNGGQALAPGEVLVRAPLDAQAVLPGDEATVIDPGDWPGTDRRLWVSRLAGRQTAVLARIICTTTQPGAD